MFAKCLFITTSIDVFVSDSEQNKQLEIKKETKERNISLELNVFLKGNKRNLCN